jgi:hypothetical protein
MDGQHYAMMVCTNTWGSSEQLYQAKSTNERYLDQWKTKPLQEPPREELG